MSEDAAILNRGYALLYLSKYKEAQREFARLSDGNLTAAYLSGSLLAGMERLDEANAIFEKLIISDCPKAEAYGIAGSARISRIRETQILEEHQRKKEKHSPQKRKELLKEFYALKRGLEKVLLQPLDCKNDVLNEFGLLLSLRANIEWYHGRKDPRMYKSAINKLEEALVQDTSFTPAMNNKGMTYFDWALLFPVEQRKETLELALDCFNNAIKMNPRYVESLINKGIVLCHLGRYPEAKDPFVQAAELNSYYTTKKVRRLGKPILKLIGIDTDCKPLRA